MALTYKEIQARRKKNNNEKTYDEIQRDRAGVNTPAISSDNNIDNMYHLYQRIGNKTYEQRKNSNQPSITPYNSVLGSNAMDRVDKQQIRNKQKQNLENDRYTQALRSYYNQKENLGANALNERFNFGNDKTALTGTESYAKKMYDEYIKYKNLEENKKNQAELKKQIKDTDSRISELNKKYEKQAINDTEIVSNGLGGHRYINADKTQNNDYLNELSALQDEKKTLQAELDKYKEYIDYSTEDDFSKYKFKGEADPNNAVRFFRTHNDEQANKQIDITQNGEVDTLHHETAYTGGGSNQSDRDFFRSITQEEADNYSYLLGKYGQDKADEYLQGLAKHTDVNNQYAELEKAREKGQKNILNASAESLGLGLATPFEAAKNIISGDEYRTIDDYALVNRQNYLRQGAADTITDVTGSKNVLPFAYNTAMSGLDNYLRYTVGSIFGGAAGSMGASEQLAGDIGKGAMRGMMAGQVMDQSMSEALNRGLSNKDAVTTALIAAFNEELFETISLENLDAMKAADVNNLKDVFKNAGKQFVTEGSEEVFTDIGNAIADDLVNGDDSEIQKNIRQYLNEGKTMEEAKRKAATDFALQLVESGLSGGLTGVGMGAGVSANNLIDFRNSQKYEKLVDNYVSQGFSTNEARQMANEAYKNELAQNKGELLEGKTMFTGKALNKAIKATQKLADNVGKMESEANEYAELTQPVVAENATTDMRYEDMYNAYNNVNQAQFNDRQTESNQTDTFDKDISNYVSKLENLDNKQISKAESNIREATNFENDLFNFIKSAPKEDASASDWMKFTDKINKMAESYPEETDTIYDAANAIAKNNANDFLNNYFGENLNNIDFKAAEKGNEVKTEKPESIEYNAEINGQYAKIVDAKGDNITIEYQDGTTDTLNASDVNMSEGTQAAVDIAKTYGNKGSKLYLENMNSNVRAYTNSFNTFYNAGRNGTDFGDIQATNFRALSDDSNKALQMAYDIYYAGSADSGKNLNKGGLVRNENRHKIDERLARSLDDLGKAIGITIQLDGRISHDANGVYDDGRMHLSLDTDKPILVVFSHELTHRLAQTSPKTYKEYEKYVIDKLKEAGQYKDVLAKIKERYANQGVELTNEVANEELAANATEMFLMDADFVEKFVDENRSLFDKVLDYIKQMISDIKKYIDTNYAAKSVEAQVISQNMDILNEARDIWTQAIKNQDKNLITKENAKGGEKFSLKEDYGKGGYKGQSMSNRAVKAYEYGEKPLSKWTKTELLNSIDDILYDNDKSELLDYFKKLTVAELKDNFLDNSSWHHTGTFYNKTDFYQLNEDTILNTTKEDIDNIISDRKPRIKLNAEEKVAKKTEEQIKTEAKDISVKLDAILKSDLYKVKTENALIKRLLNGKLDIDSAYKEAMDILRNKEEQKVKAWEKLPENHYRYKQALEFRDNFEKYANKYLLEQSSSRKSLQSIQDYIRNNNTAKYSLKEDSEGNELSKQQQEYFKDTKAVDENGNLLVMYHGTDKYDNFTIFKPGKNGYLGPGMYFSESETYADRYAKENGYEGRIYKVYLNIKNPLIVTSDTPATEILGEKVAKRREQKNSWSTRWITAADIKKLKEKGYDGIIWKYGTSPVEISVWDSNQVKNVDNENPTENPDIRFSLKESNDFYKETGFDIRTLTDPTPENIIWYASRNEKTINKYLEDRNVKVEPVIVDKKIDNFLLTNDIIKDYIKENNLDIVTLVSDKNVRDKFYNYIENDFINKIDKKFIQTRYRNLLEAIKAAVNGDDYRSGYWSYTSDKLTDDLNSIKNPTQEEDKYATKNKKQNYIEEHYNDFEKYLGDKIEKIFGWSLNGEKEKASDEDKEKHVEDAINRFGILSEENRNWNKGAYITLTGDVLDFGGKGSDIRSHDHRDISEIYDEDELTKYRLFNPTDYLNQFLSEGNVRIMPESSSIDMNSNEEPNSKQYATIRDYIDDYAAETGKCIIEFSDDDGRSVDSKYYENNINSSQIINDIKRFYSEGKIGGSNLNQFRYSLKEDSPITNNTIAEVTSKNEFLADEIKNLEDMLTSGRMFFKANQRELFQVYDEIAKEYKINNYSKKQFADNMNILFEYIADVDNPDPVTTMTLATMIAYDMIDTAGIKDTWMQEEYDGLQDFIKATRFKIADQDKNDLDGGYDYFRKKYFGKLTLAKDGIAVDSKYMELNSMYPELFPENITHPAEQLMRIGEVMDMFDTVVDSVEGATKEASAFIIARDILDKTLLNNTRGKEFDTKEKLRFQEKLRKSNANLRRAKRDIKEEYEILLNKVKAIEGERKRLERANQRLENQMGRQLKQFADFETDEKLMKRAEKYAKENQKLREKFAKKQVQDLQRTYNKERKKQLDRIKKITNKLSNMALHPKKDQYIPSHLMNSMLDVLQMIDLDSGRRTKDGQDTNISKKLKDLQESYKLMQEDSEYGIRQEYNETVDKSIGRLATITSNKRVNELDDNEISELADIMTVILHEVNNARKLINDEKNRDVRDISEKGIEQIRNANREYDKNQKFKNLANKYINDTLSPVRVFNRLENYALDGVMAERAKELVEGERKTKLIKYKAMQMLEELSQDKEAMEKFEEFRTKKLTYNVEGKKITITPDMRVALYLHSLNKQNMQHVSGFEYTNRDGTKYYRGGGVIIPNYNMQKKSQEKLDLDPKDKYTGVDAIRIVPSAVKKIIKDMTPYEKRIAELYREVNNYLTDEINKTSMELYGFKKARVEDYFPLIVDKSLLQLTPETLKVDKTLESMGFLKERIESAQPIYLEGVMDALYRQIDKSSLFAGMAIPNRNFNKVYNYTVQEGNYRNNILKQSEKAFGKYIDEYYENLVQDFAQSREKSVSDISKVLSRGKMATGVLTGNLSVVIKQMASYPTAAGGVLDFQDLLKGLSKQGVDRKDLIDRINKYSPYYKDRDTSTIAGMNLNDLNTLQKKYPKLYYVLTGWIEATDKATVRRLWYAAENYVKRTSDLEVGSDAFYEKVAEVWEDTLRKTQPIYDTMSRPEFLRQQGELTKWLMMFKTQAFQNIGILVDSFGEYQARKNDLNRLSELESKLAEYKNNYEHPSYHVSLQGLTKEEALAQKKEMQEENRKYWLPKIEETENEINQIKENYLKAKYQFKKALASQLVQAMVFAAMTAIADAIKHRPDEWTDKETGMFTAGSFFKKYLDTIISNTFSQLAYGDVFKDLIYGVYKNLKGEDNYRYDLNVMPIQVVNDTINNIQNIAKYNNKLFSLNEDDFTDNNAYRNAQKEYLKKIADTISRIGMDGMQYGFGFPIKNIKNLTTGLYENADALIHGENPLNVSSDKQQYNKIYNAYKAGDTQLAQSLSTDIDDSKLKTNMVSRLKDEKDIKAAADYRYNGDTDAYQTVIDKYVNDGFDEKWVTSAINSDMNKKYGTSGSTTNSIYNSNDLERAIDISANQGSKIASQMYDDKVNEYIEEGQTTDDAKKKALSSVKSSITSKYKSRYENGTTHDKVVIRDTLTKIRVNGQQIYTYEDISKWN